MPIGDVPAPTGVAAEAVPVTSTVANLAAATTIGFARGSAVDRAGNYYAADDIGRQVFRVSPSGTVTKILDSPALAFGLTVDRENNTYVGIMGGATTKIAANGTATVLPTSLGRAVGLDIDGAETIYAADSFNRRVLKMTRDGAVTTLVTLDPAMRLYDVAVDRAGANVYVANADANRIYKIAGSPPVVSVLAGSGQVGFADGTGIEASFNYPTGLAVDDIGNLYVADNKNGRIRRVTPNGVVTTLKAGNGIVWDVAVDALGNVYYCSGARSPRKLAPVGIGELKVMWQAPVADSPVTGYVATATAAGQESQTCSSSGETTCTLKRLASGVAYNVAVTAMTASGIGAASAPVSAVAN